MASAAEQLREISDLYDRATRLAQQVNDRLKAGQPPELFVDLLREQAEGINRLHGLLAGFSAEEFSQSDAGVREEVRRLQAAFKTLVQAAEENHRLVTQKGIRLTGVGGKPYTPRRARPRRE